MAYFHDPPPARLSSSPTRTAQTDAARPPSSRAARSTSQPTRPLQRLGNPHSRDAGARPNAATPSPPLNHTSYEAASISLTVSSSAHTPGSLVGRLRRHRNNAPRLGRENAPGRERRPAERGWRGSHRIEDVDSPTHQHVPALQVGSAAARHARHGGVRPNAD
ncbi:hypothetical protein LTR16_006926, partial [Cryomyces antarcticus]